MLRYILYVRNVRFACGTKLRQSAPVLSCSHNGICIGPGHEKQNEKEPGNPQHADARVVQQPVLRQPQRVPWAANTEGSTQAILPPWPPAIKNLCKSQHLLWYRRRRSFMRAAFCLRRSSNISRSRNTAVVGAGV